MWINNKIIKGDNVEKKGTNFKYEYDPKDIHFD